MLCMLNLGIRSAPRVTLKSSQHRFLGTQTGKHSIMQLNVYEKV